jgi:hypothetical protein
MVVFSLQTFINTFYYVQSSGRARQAAPAGRPKRTATPPHGWRAVGEDVCWSRLPTNTGWPCRLPGGRPRGAMDAGRPDA